MKLGKSTDENYKKKTPLIIILDTHLNILKRKFVFALNHFYTELSLFLGNNFMAICGFGVW